MSQAPPQANFISQIADQLQSLTNPVVVLGVDDVNRINSILLKSYLQAGATLLDGISAAVKSAIERTEERTAPPPAATKVTVK